MDNEPIESGVTTGRVPSAEPHFEDTPRSDLEKHLMHARNYGASADDLKRAWGTDFAEAEKRVLSYFSGTEQTFEDCQRQYTKNEKAGYPTPLVVPGVIYPWEAVEDGLLHLGSVHSVFAYRDGPTNRFVIPLPGFKGEDHFP